MKRILCLFLLITLLTFGVNVLAQEQPKDLEIKVIPLSEQDSKETKQIYEQYEQAIKKWDEHKANLRGKYLPNSSSGHVWSYSSTIYDYALPQFVISKDFSYLVVTKEARNSSFLQYGGAVYTPLGLTPIGGGDTGSSLVFGDGKLSFSTKITPSTLVLPASDSTSK